MKNLLITVGMYLLINTTLHASTFDEKWETGNIDSSIWESWGSPTPVISNTGYNSSYSFDNKGDGWCDSGVHTKESYELKGKSLSFDGIVTKSMSHYQDGGVGFASNTYQSGSCPEGGYNSLVYIRIRGDGNKYWVQYTIPGESHEETIDENWHNYKIDIQSSGQVKFYRDSNLVYTTSGTIDFSEYNNQRITVGGRSNSSYPLLLDNISLSSSDNSCTSSSSSGGATVSLGLDIAVPSAIYEYLGGTSDIWFNLNYDGTNSEGKHSWSLKDYGNN